MDNPFPQHTPNDGAPGEDAGHVADTSDQFKTFQEWHKRGSNHWRKWRIEAAEMFDIAAGHQWSEEDLRKLEEDLRPAVTFNRTGPFIDGVSGLEISNRQEVRYIPRQLGSAGVNDLLTAADKWARDGCDAEDEESEAFRDMLISGMGWLKTTINYDEDPDGQIIVERIDPLKLLLDPSGIKANGGGARWVMHEEDVSLEEARELAPGHDDEDLDATWAKDVTENADDPHDARAAPFYRNDQSGRQEGHEDAMVRLIHVEWWEMEDSYRVADPRTGSLMRLTPSQHSMLQKRAAAVGVPIKSVKDRHRKYRKALVGAKILSTDDGPEQGGFTYKTMTGKRDRRLGCWYGMVRPMKDPQQWANKWLSQMLHIMNSNAKGGLLAEEDAFTNPHDAEDSWSDPTAITWVAPGALAAGRVQFKPAITYPNGPDKLMQYAVESIPGVTGFSAEMMGMTDRTQPGVVEAGRKQQGMILLAPYFNALRRYRKEHGRLMLWLIQTFISDGRLIRIGGPEDAQYVPLIRDKMIGEYDVVVDDTPTSPNMKERVWGSIVQLMPVMARLGLPPEAYLPFLEYSPMPAALVQKLQKMAAQAAQQPHTDPHAAALAQETQAKAAERMAQTQHIQAKTNAMGMDLHLKQQTVAADIEAKKAMAIAALAKVGLDADAAGLARDDTAMQALLGAHEAALAASQHGLDAQQQAHQQALDWAQHAAGVQQAQSAQELAEQQAAQPQGGNQ